MKGNLMLEIDSKGRPLPHTMSDRAMAEETLILLRAFGDILQSVGSNPIAGAMLGNMGLALPK